MPYPPSPGVQSPNFDQPLLNQSDTPRNSDFITPNPDQPRFLGPAQALDGFTRESYASSGGMPYGQQGEFNNSSAALAGGYRDDPNSSNATSAHGFASEKAYGGAHQPRAKSNRKKIILIALAALLIIIVVVVVAIYFTVIKPKNDESSGNSGNQSGSDKDDKPGKGDDVDVNVPVLAVTGGDGSEITMEDGTKFIYNNTFGGTWYWDPKDPLNMSAKAQSYTPAMNATWQYGVDRIRGVNLGGWLNTEPVSCSISPVIQFMRLTDISLTTYDEWTLSEQMRLDTAGGGIEKLMEDHYKTFITEEDFAKIAAAGLNWIRLPIGWWAIEVLEGEPFLPKVSWNYFLKAIEWARKYGLRINLDLHAVPGSQNGWNHSGRLGETNFLRGPAGYVNAQRTLDYIRILTEFISQPQYKDVVPMFGILNEVKNDQTGEENVLAFYYEAYRIMREVGGIGAGNGPIISYHDAFLPRSTFNEWLPNADRISLDNHPYLCFNEQSSAPYSTYINTPCTAWSDNYQSVHNNFGLIVAGEFSNAITDCGLYLNGVGDGTRYEGDYIHGTWPRRGSCEEFTDYARWDAQTRDDIMQFALHSMDALGNYFFWTWRIGESLESGKVETPAWSYKLGLEERWMPTDPRVADGLCVNGSPADIPLKPHNLGAPGSGVIPAAVTQAIVWPPATITMGGALDSLPVWTPTGELPILPVPTFADAPDVDVGTGWHSSDRTGMAVNPAGCPAVDGWVLNGGDVAAAVRCGGSATTTTPAPEAIA
ncbi:glycoside hydrolase superfamily [Pterulicium gracile]|uniref:glucan 1,3-beta-glucosidase n=1 Tax=Pterulicium gracile TaxID=1884261 RepID=A0A5C3QPL3_9AGAR|nr:glycoside hydrolase superfamily [Pterula gracilis]